jgi:uncharacterized protein
MNKTVAARRIKARNGVFFPRLTPMSAIREFARQIAERFHPDTITLFGSYAYGKPTPDSDVDLLVVMPTRNQIEQAVRIDEAIDERGFPLDLIVRTPRALAKALRGGDFFMQDIMARGKVLYEKSDKAMGPQSRKRSRRRPAALQASAGSQG